jgi:hypothetical protein
VCVKEEVHELVLNEINVVVYSKNKFEKLVHLSGFITGIYQDALSSECPTVRTASVNTCHKPLSFF